MEHGLWPVKTLNKSHLFGRLNPCLNGTWSLTWNHIDSKESSLWVLILVWMEHGLWLPTRDITVTFSASLNPCLSGTWSLTTTALPKRTIWASLNPCLSGTWSLTVQHHGHVQGEGEVLILVWVEHGLWHQTSRYPFHKNGLNPCLSGTWSLTCKAIH